MYASLKDEGIGFYMDGRLNLNAFKFADESITETQIGLKSRSYVYDNTSYYSRIEGNLGITKQLTPRYYNGGVFMYLGAGVVGYRYCMIL